MAILGKLAIVTIVLILSFTLLYIPGIYWGYNKYSKEAFTTSPSTIIMEAQNPQGLLTPGSVQKINNTLADKDSVGDLDDSNNLLKMKACFQIDRMLQPNSSNIPFDTKAYTMPFDGLVTGELQIVEKIINVITTFQQRIGVPLKGAVYVLMTQVPYYLNDRKNPVDVGYYTNERFKYEPTNARTDVYISGIVVFANYLPSKQHVTQSLFEKDILPQLYTRSSNDKQCFIRCLNSPFTCGCASAPKGIYNDNPQFDVTCFGRSTSADMQKSGSSELAASSFYTYFQVNRLHKSVRSLFD